MSRLYIVTLNLYAEYIMRNAGLEETQAGIKIAGRNINNPRYADDTTLMAESEEKLKSLLMKVKGEREKVGLKLNIQNFAVIYVGEYSPYVFLYFFALPAYLTSMQSTSGETLGWKKHKLESRLMREISITSDMQMTPPLWQKVKRNSKAS